MDFFNVFSLSIYLNCWLPVVELQVLKLAIIFKIESNPGLFARCNPEEVSVDGAVFKVGWLKVHLYKSVF